MTLIAAMLGLVVGYGLALLRDFFRVRSCERDCAALRTLLRQRDESDIRFAELLVTTDRMARRLVLQERLDARRVKG